MPMSLCPAIFSLSQYQFQTEINGLLYKDNIALYALIENIFIKMIPMFEAVLNKKLLNNDQYKQISVIVKIQDYQFKNECEVKGKWHSEGDKTDHIAAVGLYYFDITSNGELHFSRNSLDIAEQNQRFVG